MDELVGRLVAETGIDRDVATKAVAIILAFLVKEGPAGPVKSLFEKLPGAEASAKAGANAPGSFASGIMGAGMQLMDLGLDMEQVENVTRVVITHARTKAGEDLVGQIVAAIPGLSQLS